jgi:hypothetical protein
MMHRSLNRTLEEQIATHSGGYNFWNSSILILAKDYYLTDVGFKFDFPQFNYWNQITQYECLLCSLFKKF